MSIVQPSPCSWLLRTLLVSSLLLTHSAAIGQSSPENQPLSGDSTQGYWRVYTDYATRTTYVSFYASRHELLYQEKIKDRYVNLSKRTIRQFDDLLMRLVNHNLVVNQVKSYDLLASNQWIASSPSEKTRTESEDRVPLSVGLHRPMVNLKLVNPGQLLLTYRNPAGEQLLITIADDSFHYLYKNQSKEKEHAGLINISHLPTGIYRVGVDGPQKKALYQVSIDQDAKSLNLRTLLNQF
ncbi:hypothetical protein [Spirosoma koreense]